MKKLIILATIFLMCFPAIGLAEDKAPGGQIIPKLAQTPEDPVLEYGHVYPFWGAPCARYTYSVIYRDEQARPPEYVRIYFNGDWIDMEKENAQDDNYTRGVKYIYQYVPESTESNFYFFEASNGKGKARDSIIDSPDNGPVLFTSSLDNNEIAVLEQETGKFLWRFSTGQEWVSKVAISRNNKYLAAKTSRHVYLFEIERKEPLWTFTLNAGPMIGDDVDGGGDISADGKRIIAMIGSGLYLFSNTSGEPLWRRDIGGSAYGVSISPDGSTIAVAVAASQDEEKSNLLVLFDDKGNELWSYQSSGNFHSADLNWDGSVIAVATGCPDRRAYIFLRQSNEPLLRSDMLTRDSPIHASAISDDGETAAFGAESDAGALHVFSQDSSDPLWKFTTPRNRSIRSLAITPDGQYIGAGTFGGDAYIFSHESSAPLSHYTVEERLGSADISDDGALLAVGGSNNNLYLFSKEEARPRWQVSLNEYINSLDMSPDNKYIAAGTGASIYFFESDEFNQPKVQKCEQVIEPPPEMEMQTQMGIEDNDIRISDNFDNFNGFAIKNGKETKKFPLMELLSVSLGVLLIAASIMLWPKKSRKTKTKK
ncbi:WD40 repeat domain-containing protein [Patescibacteria group bacterium]|nr:WD40 repeat domain-containing protein [Patescibacteria group bacterium]